MSVMSLCYSTDPPVVMEGPSAPQHLIKLPGLFRSLGVAKWKGVSLLLIEFYPYSYVTRHIRRTYDTVEGGPVHVATYLYPK